MALVASGLALVMLNRTDLLATLDLKQHTLDELRQALDKYRDEQRWYSSVVLNDTPSEVALELSDKIVSLVEETTLLKQMLHETCWSLLEEFGKAVHVAFKAAEPSINADTTLVLLREKRRVVYYAPLRSTIRFHRNEQSIDIVSHITQTERKECHLRLFTNGTGRYLALGFASEINTIFWCWWS